MSDTVKMQTKMDLAGEYALQYDWTKVEEASNVGCKQCSAEFRSKATMRMLPTPIMYSERACPNCGCYLLRKISSGWETMTVNKEDVGGV